MYLLGPNTIYVVQVMASCVWILEGRIWAPEVFIVGEGILFRIYDNVRLMAQPNRANIIAVELGMKTHGH